MSVALPIPEPRADDDEDVHWALSTASALWARGESQEALKWLRRAAETASDVNRDMRALELFKAAADFTGRIQAAAGAASGQPPLPPIGSAPPPMPVSHAAPTPQVTPPPAGAGGPPPMPGAARAGGQAPPAAAAEMRRSAPPPPPPRGRAVSSANLQPMPTTSFPSVGRPRMPSSPGEIGEERIEPMAPTVLGPPQAAAAQARAATAAATPDRPFAVHAATTLVAGKGLDTKAAKTLASNMSYGNLQRQEQEQFRNAVSKASTITAAQAREIASAAARQMPGLSDRATHAGVGPMSLPEPAPATQVMPAPPAHTPATALQPPASQLAKPAGPPAAATAPAASAAQPSAAARGTGKSNVDPRAAASSPAGATGGPSSGPASDRSRAQAKRRATLRRQGGVVKPEPVIRDSARIPEARPTQRFEEEITIERDLSHIQGQSGGSDLDENTNVLSGQEVDVEVGEAQATPGDPSLRSEGANGAPAEASGDADGDSAPEPVTSIHRAAVMPQVGAQGLSAFRIALVSDVVTGVIEATLLAAGEPVPAGRIPAVVVATDAASSSALAELFSRSNSTRKGTRS